MAVAFDAVGAGVNAAAVNSFSWTHTPVGTPTAVGVGVSWYDESFVLSITYGGAAMASEVAITNSPLKSEMFSKANPASGAQTVAGSWTGGAHYPIGNSITVTGSDTATCFSNTASASGSGTAITVACTSAVGELVMDTVTHNSGSTISGGAGQTERWNATNSGLRGAGSTEAGAATVTMSWTGGAAGAWVQTAASFKDASAGGGGGGTSGMLLLSNDMQGNMGRLGGNFQ